MSTAADGVSPGRLVRSEWVKLATLRSTWWTLSLTLLGIVAIAVLGALASTLQDRGGGQAAPAVDVGAMTPGILVGQVAVAVLGVSTMTGEHSTGTLRATMTAVPRRVPVLLAKATVLLLVALVLGVVGVLLALTATLPFYGAGAPELTSSRTWRVVAGAGLYLGGVAVLSLALGALLRSAAGALALTLGVLLVLPTLLSLTAVSGVDWLVRAVPYLPGEAGAVVLDPAALEAGPGLGPWSGLAVMAVWATGACLLAAALLRHRDV